MKKKDNKIIKFLVILNSLILTFSFMCQNPVVSYANTVNIFYDADTNPNGNLGIMTYVDENDTSTVLAQVNPAAIKDYSLAGDTQIKADLNAFLTETTAGKKAVSEAITAKGVTCSNTADFYTQFESIVNIPAGNSPVLGGKDGPTTIKAHFCNTTNDAVGNDSKTITFSGNTFSAAMSQYRQYIHDHRFHFTSDTVGGCYGDSHYTECGYQYGQILEIHVTVTN